MRRRLPSLLAAHVVIAIAACVGTDPAPVDPDRDGGPAAPPTNSSGSLPPDDASTCPNLTTFAETRAFGIDALPDGGFVVVDREGHAIRRVESDGAVVPVYDGGDGFKPTRVFERQGHYLVLDEGQYVVVTFDPTDGGSRIFLAAPHLSAVGGLQRGPVYVARRQGCGVFYRGATFKDSDLVLVAGSAAATGTAGSGCPGSVDGDRNRARFGDDLGDIEAADAALYVADRTNHRVRIVDISDIDASANVTTLAGGAAGSKDGRGDAASFSDITGLAVDPAAHVLYVADGNRIRAIDAEGNVRTLAAGEGCEDPFTEVHDLAYADGALFIADGNRVRKLVLTP